MLTVYARSYVCMGVSFSHYGLLYLENKMTDKNITLNCLITFIGKLMNIPCTKVMQAITFHKYDGISKVETAIQSRLGDYLIISLWIFSKFIPGARAYIISAATATLLSISL